MKALYCFIVFCAICCDKGLSAELSLKNIRHIDVAECLDDGQLKVLFTSQSPQFVKQIYKEIDIAKQNKGPRVRLEPGPVILLKNKQNEILAAFLIRLDMSLTNHHIKEVNGKVFLGSKVDFRGKSYLTIKSNGFISSILGLWYQLHQLESE